MKPIKYIQTVCSAGHMEQVTPATINGEVAIFGSAADVCWREGCEAPVTERTPIYEEP